MACLKGEIWVFGIPVFLLITGAVLGRYLSRIMGQPSDALSALLGAAGARGHVDCMEVVKDNAVAKAVPVVNVTNPLAKVTHEAAIGSVDKRQLETLMSHGLSPEKAVDIIVKGLLT